MSQPVKISDALLLDARQVGGAVERSIAGQIEFWAKFSRAMEPLLRGDQVLALTRAGGAKLLSASLASVDSAAGRQRVAEYLKTRPYPHFEADCWSVLTPADAARWGSSTIVSLSQ